MNIKKIAIDFGHNCENDKGAIGIEQEDKLIREVGQKLITLLDRDGYKTLNVTPKYASGLLSSLKQRVHTCNGFNADIFFSIHFNAFNKKAYGTEAYYLSQTGKLYADSIVTEISKLGYHNRGAKLGRFYVLKHTTCPAVLIECCFCDNPSDMEVYNSTRLAVAIRNGINLDNDNTYSKGIRYRLKVNYKTVFKATTEPAEHLILVDKGRHFKSNSCINLNPGQYQVLDFYCIEDSHYYLKLKPDLVGFIYKNHAELISG